MRHSRAGGNPGPSRRRFGAASGSASGAIRLTPGAAPATLTDGQIWYDSTAAKFKKREAGATSDLDTTGAASSTTVHVFPPANYVSSSTGAYATMGNVIVPSENFSINQIVALVDAVAGAVYSAFIATLDDGAIVADADAIVREEIFQ